MKIPSVLNIGMCIMDIVFNYIYIYILDMGVVGAAIGTGCAELVTAILMLYFLLAKSPMLSLRGHPGSFKPKAETVGTAVKIGAPMGLQHLLMGSAQIVSTLIVAPLGTISIAAHSLAITVESLCYMPGYGIADAATTLTGQGIGAGQKLLTQTFAYMSVGLGITVMTLMGVLMWIFAPELMSIMSPVEEVILQGTEILRIEAWADVCCSNSCKRSIHWSWGHNHPCHNEPRIDVGSTPHPCSHPRTKIWLERRMDCYGYRTDIPRQHIPCKALQR